VGAGSKQLLMVVGRGGTVAATPTASPRVRAQTLSLGGRAVFQKALLLQEPLPRREEV